MSEREAFEKWADEQGLNLETARLGYRNEATDTAWDAWQARAAAPAAPAEPVAIIKPPINPVFEQGRLEFLTDALLPYGTLLYTHPAAPAPDDQWDRNAERLTQAAFGDGQINPNAMSVNDIFDSTAAPAPDSATVDGILRKLDACIFEPARTPIYYELRAAIEQVVRENAALRDALDRLQQTWAENKPAVAYKERAERAERERDTLKAVSEKYLEQGGINFERAERAEQKYEELAASIANLSHPNCQLLLRDKRHAERALAEAQQDAERWREHVSILKAATMPDSLHIEMRVNEGDQNWAVQKVLSTREFGRGTVLGSKAVGLTAERMAKELDAAIDAASEGE